ncbi:multidrug efflux protein [Halieaceae bacterium IMCC14734]|uniref:Multidrug efflux protein n=1 Tax=Candidatus Litorirhabdus singularis TaxID=2518993 RepID=A0ABT3TH42_9GAMM|nr:efflux RND transporter permease subunit [Candidatus Litorirhabdus singularis]MCX2981076.1 multidrug efflux protein [Candidatus Litorirhabdus singularis]
MAFTDLFIKRPVLAIVVSCLLLLLGAQAASQLEIRQFPELEKSVIYVNTFYPGASASTVQGFVTTPLQNSISAARGVEYLTSTSSPGSSRIQVHVRLGENTSEVLSEVIAKVNEARSTLPREIEDPIASTSTGGDAMMYLAFLSEEMSSAQITDYVIRSIQPEINTLDGVGVAEVFSSSFAMRVWLDPTRMAAAGVTATDVSSAIQRENYVSTAGTTRGLLVRASVDAATDMQSPGQFANIVVRQIGERRVRLGDVAKLELDQENYDFTQFSTDRPAIFLKINEAPGANPLQVAKRIHAVLPAIEAQFPADMELFIDMDASIQIEGAMLEVVKTLLEAAAIVMLVIYLFLGSIRVVIIPLLTIPLSLIGVLFGIFAMGFSINLLTLLAMVIAIGLVVDDAIVVVENVHRHIEDGKQPREAALLGARQVALPVIAMTLTLAAVYAPIGFLGGITGTLFSEFALTLAGAVMVSGIVALTLSPMMCATFLQNHEKQGKVADWLDQRFDSLRALYQRGLQASLANRGAIIMFALVILVSLPLLLSLSQKELAPAEDSGFFFVVATPPDYSNIEYVTPFLKQLISTVKAVPEFSHSFHVNSTSTVFGGIQLVPWDERTRTQQEIQAEVQSELSRNSGLEVFSFGSPALPGTGGGLPLQFVVSSTADYERVDEVAEELMQAARESGLFIFVTKDLRFSRPEISVKIDRDRAARLGVSMREIGQTLQIMLGEAEVNRFSLEGRSYKVIPQAGNGFRLTKEWLERYYVRSSSGRLITLDTLISIEQTVQPNTLAQYQQLNSATISGMVMPPNTLGTGLEFLEQKLAEIAPSGFKPGYTGESRRYIQETGSFLILFTASLLLIYLVLAAQFNSFRDPFVVLISVPMSIFGAVVPIALGFASFNIYTQVGLLTLIGLISKHGILIVDFANQLVLQGRDRQQAVIEAAGLRLRPILMTTFATVLGVSPLLMAAGPGANSRYVIGLMITAGMLVGTLFTLFVLPVFYMLLEKRGKTVDSLGYNAAATDTAAEPATG